MNKPLPAYSAKPIPDETPITSYGSVIDAKQSLLNCGDGMSFVVDTASMRQRMIGFAERMGYKIKTRKNGTGRFDIWRI